MRSFLRTRWHLLLGVGLVVAIVYGVVHGVQEHQRAEAVEDLLSQLQSYERSGEFALLYQTLLTDQYRSQMGLENFIRSWQEPRKDLGRFFDRHLHSSECDAQICHLSAVGTYSLGIAHEELTLHYQKEHGWQIGFAYAVPLAIPVPEILPDDVKEAMTQQH